MLHAPTLDQDDIDFAAEAALTYCTDCRDYHFIRPYQQATHPNLGPWADADTFVPLLRDAIPDQGSLLIAGSADAGLMAFALEAVGERLGRLVVADRCEAPLAVCRRFAARRGVQVETETMDLTASAPKGPFHAVVAHIFLRFLPPDLRAAFLRNAAAQLHPGGVLIVADLVRTGAPSTYRSQMKERIFAGMAQRGLAIRDPEALISALAREAAPNTRIGSSPEEVIIRAEEAGLTVRSRAVSQRLDSTGAVQQKCEYVVLCR